eukprot:12890228-Prorocentrum_lima.AAC.1
MAAGVPTEGISQIRALLAPQASSCSSSPRLALPYADSSSFASSVPRSPFSSSLQGGFQHMAVRLPPSSSTLLSSAVASPLS